MLPFVSRVKKNGQSLVAVLPVDLLKVYPLNHADRIAIRVTGTKLILERIPLENLARLGVPETQAIAT